MRTSRSMSWTFSSVMRAWPRIVLTSRLRRSVRAEATSSAVKYVSTLGCDDSIVRSRRRRRHADGAGAQRAEPRRPRVLPRRSDPGRALLGRPTRSPCWSAGSRKALSIVIDVAGIGSDRPGRALRLRAGAVGDALARARRLRAREPLRSACRRAPRARHARRRRRRARLAFPGPGPSAGRVDLGAAALAARRRVVRPVRRRRAARAPPQPRRAADATRAAAAPILPRTACRCCASSG